MRDPINDSLDIDPAHLGKTALALSSIPRMSFAHLMQYARRVAGSLSHLEKIRAIPPAGQGALIGRDLRALEAQSNTYWCAIESDLRRRCNEGRAEP